MYTTVMFFWDKKSFLFIFCSILIHIIRAESLSSLLQKCPSVHVGLPNNFHVATLACEFFALFREYFDMKNKNVT